MRQSSLKPEPCAGERSAACRCWAFWLGFAFRGVAMNRQGPDCEHALKVTRSGDMGGRSGWTRPANPGLFGKTGVLHRRWNCRIFSTSKFGERIADERIPYPERVLQLSPGSRSAPWVDQLMAP